VGLERSADHLLAELVEAGARHRATMTRRHATANKGVWIIAYDLLEALSA
jgi:hypothetical protein